MPEVCLLWPHVSYFGGLRKRLCGTEAAPHFHGYCLGLFPPISATSYIKTESCDLVT